MPIYEYECPVCGAREERVRPIADMDAPVSCVNNPECNGAGDAPPTMVRKPTAPAGTFPGAAGWRSGR